MNIKPYGKELIIDLKGCDTSKFNRDSLTYYFVGLCKIIDMQRCSLHFWDDMGVAKEDRQILPHTKGTSAVQFILTSNITVHTLDLLGEVYINIFSCKKFDHLKANDFTVDWFNATKYNYRLLTRGAFGGGNVEQSGGNDFTSERKREIK